MSLERALQHYTLEPSEKPFDLKSVPVDMAPVEATPKKEEGGISMGISKTPEKPAASRQDIYAGILKYFLSQNIFQCSF